MKTYATPLEFSQLTGYSITHINRLRSHERIVMHHEMVHVEESLKRMLETVDPRYQNRIRELISKIGLIDIRVAPKDDDYVTKTDFLRKLGLCYGHDLDRILKKYKDAPVGQALHGKEGMQISFQRHEVDAFIERHRLTSFSHYLASQFIRGDFRPQYEAV